MDTRAENLPQLPASLAARFQVEFEPLEVDGETFRVLGVTNMDAYIARLLAEGKIRNPLADLPLWAKVWPAAIVLGRFLRKYEPQGKTMLELGAGVGVCSLVASQHGFQKITATDIEEDALEFARINVTANNRANISVKKLDVAQPGLTLPEKPDFICASELLYLPELHRPILKFVKRNLAPGGKAFFCVDLKRGQDRFEKMAAKEFQTRSGCVGVKSRDEKGEQRSIYKIIILESPKQ